MEKKQKTKKEKTASPKNASDKLTNQPTKKDFLVVGLGASAGGVKALQEFFATMPPNSGMAFVAILHLSPEHESSLPQILQAQTLMKVTQVTQTVKVEPNNVYVIPPNVQLEMVDGVIRPAKAERPHGNRVAIDVFFRTLAEAYEKNAVCVVLSGTGSDGTLGLKRVKESNGFAIVQDPEDAEYDSMPRSAINTQLADWILPVHKMPERLIHFKESSERLHLTNGADAKQIAEEINADESLREILTILRVRTGHDFSSYKTPTLVRRIARHLQIHELEDIPTYLNLLRREPNEVHSLLKNLLINVTNFFRDKEAFQTLQRTVVPKIFEGKTGSDTLRVWSCGCASGEEAYSLAIILQEYAETLPDPPKIQVFASDVDEEALVEAREHRYPEAIEADVSLERLKKFFIREGAYYRIRKELRETVLFAPHNVLRDPPFSRLDLISCRNLMIYLNRMAQEKVMEIFHFALVSQGFLFLGSSETADGTGHLFAPVDKKQKIYSRRYSATQNYLPVMPVAGRWEVPMPGEKAEATRERQMALSDIHYKLLEHYAPSSVLVNQDFDIVYLSGTAGKFMRFTSGEPSHNILKAVNPDLLPDLRAALFTAQRERRVAEFPNVRVNIDGEQRVVNVIVRAVDVSDELADYLLVIFEERNLPHVIEEAERVENLRDKDEAMETIVRRLEEDLQRTKEHLRFTLEQHDTTIEELKAANEELQAINEELRSAGEELETSKEELQSVNEELITVNHEYKEKIEESSRINSDLLNLMEATDIATIFLDKNLQIKRYTPPIEEFFNITHLDIGRPLEHFTHHLDFTKMTQEAAKVLRTLKPIERETADEKGNTFLARFLPYRTIDDRIEGVVLNFIEITERKRAEEAALKSQTAVRLIANAAPALVWVCDAKGANVYFNDRWFEYTGQTEKAAEDYGLTKAMHPDDAAEILPYWERCRQTGEVYEGEVRFRRKDGAYRWHHFRALPHRNDAGEIEAWYGVSVDINDSKLAEIATRESENLSHLFVTASSEIIYRMDADWSEMRLLEGKGFLPDTKNPSRNWLEEYIPDTDRSLTKAAIKRAVRAKAIFEFEHRAIKADGSIGWVFSRAIPLLDENGEITEWFGAASDITERKQAEESLAKSEEHYRAIFNQNLAGIFETDLSGKIIFANEELCRMLGYKSETLSGVAMKEFVHPEDFPESLEKLERMQKSKKPFEMEKRFVKKDGSVIWVHNSVSPITSSDRNIHSAVIVSLDITRRKEADLRLREAEERTRITLEAAELATWEWNVETNEVLWNEQHYRLFGMKPRKKRMTPDDFFRHVHPDYRDYVAAALQKSVDEKAPFDVEFCAVLTGGETRWMSGYGRVTQTDKNGKTTLMSGVMFDITERKTAAETLRKNKEQLQLILESTKDYSIITYDLKGIITRWNTGAEKIFGYTESEMIGVKGDILFTPEDRAAGVPAREFEIAVKKGRAEDERWHLRKDGSRFFASGVMQPLKDGEIEGFVKIARDQTEKLRAETALREQELLRQFVRTQEDERRRIARDMHDELGQQLTALRMKLDTVRKASAEPVLLNQLNEISDIARNLDEGVDFLAFELRPSVLGDFGLVAALDNYIKQWSRYAGVKAELTVSNLKRARFKPEVETNLYRIVQEALNNTHKHAKATRADIVLEKRGDLLILIVEDNGKGFNQKSKKNQRQGIGLIGMNERVELMGGKFELETAPKQGTTIYVRIPFSMAKEKESYDK